MIWLYKRIGGLSIEQEMFTPLLRPPQKVQTSDVASKVDGNSRYWTEVVLHFSRGIDVGPCLPSFCHPSEGITNACKASVKLQQVAFSHSSLPAHCRNHVIILAGLWPR